MIMMNTIKFIRKNIFKVTQKDFASICGVTQAVISNWEREDPTMPGLTEMQAIRSEALSRGLKWSDSVFFQQHNQVDSEDNAT